MSTKIYEAVFRRQPRNYIERQMLFEALDIMEAEVGTGKVAKYSICRRKEFPACSCVTRIKKMCCSTRMNLAGIGILINAVRFVAKSKHELWRNSNKTTSRTAVSYEMNDHYNRCHISRIAQSPTRN